ncbi:carboxypeptidase-like regulatory domain-containing protein [Terriglobus sp.]|uniref:carboxypeptidase-like regulatory domain-containing protein n=1 Tax=Terriglobus sp. TaxID=1889013 RepID=UPI003B00F05D
MRFPGSPFLLLIAAFACGANSRAATLHGRVKDQQCSVLSQASIRIHSAKSAPDRTLTTDDGGNYNVELPAGNYQLCVQRGAHTLPACTDLVIGAKGDVWITTQLRDAAPDLSNIGNHSY